KRRGARPGQRSASRSRGDRGRRRTHPDRFLRDLARRPDRELRASQAAGSAGGCRAGTDARAAAGAAAADGGDMRSSPSQVRLLVMVLVAWCALSAAPVVANSPALPAAFFV